MAVITKSLIAFAKKEKRSVLEIMNEFKIDKKHVETLRRALKKEGVKLKDNRGRRKEVFGVGDFVDMVKVKKDIAEIYKTAEAMGASIHIPLLYKKIKKLDKLVNA